MNSRHILPQALNFIMYMILQVLIVRNLVLFDVSFCYLYIGFLLLLPIEVSIIMCMMLGFTVGILVDIFYNTFGIHAAACVFIMYIRHYWIETITPRGGYDLGVTPTPQSLGLRWFITYAFPLTLVHHALIFYIEMGGFDLFYYTLIKVLASTAFTLVMVVVIQYILHSSRRPVL